MSSSGLPPDFDVYKDKLASLSRNQWRAIIEHYMVSSVEAAKRLDVSLPRFWQIVSVKGIKSVVKGYFLRQEIEVIRGEVLSRRRMYRRDVVVLSTEAVYQMIVKRYLATKRPVTTAALIDEAKRIDRTDQIVIKHRINKSLRILLEKKLVTRVGRGRYLPIGV